MMIRHRLEEFFYRVLMIISLVCVLGVLFLILGTILWKGLPALNIQMITRVPQGGYYFGKEGGILNAIVGSLYLAGGATAIAILLSFPVALFLQVYASRSPWREWVRLSLDVMWGIPSIVYGAFGFTLMLFLGMRASLLSGIITLAFLELPIMIRGMEEVVSMIPDALLESSYSLGATRLETAFRVILPQTASGLATAVLLAFGRGIGDAASVLFTAGYTDRLPDSLLSPAASLPLAVFFQLGTPYPAVQERAYASALVLTAMILILSVTTRTLTKRFSKHIIH